MVYRVLVVVFAVFIQWLLSLFFFFFALLIFCANAYRELLLSIHSNLYYNIGTACSVIQYSVLSLLYALLILFMLPRVHMRLDWCEKKGNRDQLHDNNRLQTNGDAIC